MSRPIRIVERLLPSRVSCENHSVLARVPDCNREHAIESIEALDAPLLVGAQHDLAIGLAHKPMPFIFELRPERPKVVDLSIEDRLHRRIGAGHGHPASFTQIDDRESPVPEPDGALEPKTCIVRSTVHERVAHALQRDWVYRPSIELPRADDSTHQFMAPRA